MTEATKTEKPKPTMYTLRVHNAGKVEVPLPTGVDKLAPGETIEVTVPVNKAVQYTGNRQLVVTRIGDNSDQLAAAQAEREQRIASARDRLGNLRKTLDERLVEEREIESRIVVLEADEASAEGRDRDALREAGRSPENTATSVLMEAGATREECRGLEFDLWGATLRRLEAEAAHSDALAVVAADDARLHREKVAAAEEAVKEAQAHVQRIRDERVGVEDREVRAKRTAANARRKLARLEESGPERVA